MERDFDAEIKQLQANKARSMALTGRKLSPETLRRMGVAKDKAKISRIIQELDLDPFVEFRARKLLEEPFEGDES